MELSIEANVKNIDRVTGFVNDRLKQMGCSRRSMLQIDVALDELFSNICHYAYGSSEGIVNVSVEELADRGAAQIVIADKGVPFDPTGAVDPDVNLGIHERAIGGLGIFLVKRTMDAVTYEYQEGKNILTVVKSL